MIVFYVFCIFSVFPIFRAIFRAILSILIILSVIFFFLIIASEFFINYKLVFKDGDKMKNAIKKIFKKKSAIAENIEAEVNE